MARLTDAQLAKKDIVDAVRTAARLEMRMKLRRILNEVENDILEEYEKRLAKHEPFELDVRSVLDSVSRGFEDEA
jgi:hypothetical protein